MNNIIPLVNDKELEIQKIIDEINEFCKNIKLEGLLISELKNEGKR